MLVWCSRAAARASRWNRAVCLGSSRAVPGQDLQGHVAAQRLLLGLVDDAHAAAADLAEDAEVAQLLQRRRPRARRRRRGSPVRSLTSGLELLHQHERREEVADPARPTAG